MLLSWFAVSVDEQANHACCLQMGFFVDVMVTVVEGIPSFTELTTQQLLAHTTYWP